MSDTLKWRDIIRKFNRCTARHASTESGVLYDEYEVDLTDEYWDYAYDLLGDVDAPVTPDTVMAFLQVPIDPEIACSLVVTIPPIFTFDNMEIEAVFDLDEDEWNALDQIEIPTALIPPIPDDA